MFDYSYLKEGNMTNKTTVDLTNRIDTVKIGFREFEQVAQCPVQRNHDKRAKEKKTREKLGTLQPQHCIVTVAVLMKDSYDPTSGVTYLANTTFLIDGHTRRKFWQLGYSDNIPEYVLATRFTVDTVQELRELYYTFDNATNVEKPADLAYGACRLLDLQLTNHRLYDVSAFTWAAHFYNKNLFTKSTGYDGHGLINIYSLFRSEVEFLDSFKWNTPYRLHGPLRTATLLFLKKYDDDVAKTIVKRVFTDDFDGRDLDGKYDGVTNLIQWLKKPDEDWAQSYTTIPILTDKFLYWLNQAYLEETTGKERVTKKGNHHGIRSEYVQQSSINPFVAAA
jgi:hypothetical protein